MWISKGIATFITIQYKGKGKIKFTFPISLYIFMELLDGIKDFLTVAKFLFPSWENRIFPGTPAIAAKNVVEVLLQLIKGLKETKGFTLVEVHVDDIYIKIAFV